MLTLCTFPSKMKEVDLFFTDHFKKIRKLKWKVK